jgi:phosphoribosyl-dephospho-CoA transferase
MILQRHSLLAVTVTAWQELMDLHADLAEIPLVAEWSLHGRPVIIRRRTTCDPENVIPVALPLPPSRRKQRLAFTIASSAGVSQRPAVSLTDAGRNAPDSWHPTIRTLLNLGAKLGVVPHVYGALLWQHLTGLTYLSASSDIDLLWRPPNLETAALLVEELFQLDALAPVRIDGDLEFPDGASVNWREWIDALRGNTRGVLVKTMDGVEIRPTASLFETLARCS